MSKQHYSPRQDTNANADTNSASVSSRSETTDKARQGIAETFKPGKNYDAEMETKFGKEPNEQDVIAKFAGQEKFKGKNFQEILAQLEQDDNKPMTDRLRKKVKNTTSEAERKIKDTMGESQFNALSPEEKRLRIEAEQQAKNLNTKKASENATDEETKKYLAERGYDDNAGIKPIDEKAKKKIESNKSADIKGFTLLGGEKLQVGDIIIAQTGGKSGNPIFRFNADKKNYESINYKGADAGEARMQELKKLFKWHEVAENDIKKEPEKKPEPQKIATVPQSGETFKNEKKTDKKPGFLKRAAKGTGKVIARPFKKSRQAVKRPFKKSAKNKDKKGIHNTRIGRAVTRPVRKSRNGLKKMGRRLAKPLKRKSKEK